ncbi:MAG: hypothetical protein U0935_14100 [Pirellulales bacterium]
MTDRKAGRAGMVSLAVAVGLVVTGAVANPVWGQRGENYEAIPGTPWGVARLVLSGEGEVAEALESNNLTLVERDGRALYPVFTTGRFRKLLGEVLGLEQMTDPALHVLFLFRGTEPLRITVTMPQPRELILTPRPSVPRAGERLMQQWWREYNGVVAQQLAAGDSPPIPQTYLASMLSRRTGLPQPSAVTPLAALTQGSSATPAQARESIELLLGLEKLHLATIREAMLRPQGPIERAVLPLPQPIPWGPSPPVEFDREAAIEPLARRVPEEWFYVRFARLANQTWLDKLTAEYGGDLGSMVTLRGLRGRAGERMETQLSLPPPQNAIEEVVGDAMVADIALVGRDIYLENGAAVGVLFQLRTPLFVTNLQSHRQEVVEREKGRGATLTTERIAGRDVSLLATPDHRLRSFMLHDGDFLLVTSSRAMVERFCELGAGTGAGSLAELAEFRRARTQFPLGREDTIFAFFSSSFFRGLLSPQYQVEVGRRLRSLADLQIVQLAQWAAHAEHLDADEPADLERVGLLPPQFALRPEGGFWREEAGEWLDTVRGARGTFLPIPDVPIKGVTAREAEQCRRQADFYASHWKQMDPLVVAVKRHVEEGNRERIAVEARLSLLDESKYGPWLSVLGPPMAERMESQGNEVIFAEAQLRGGVLFPQIPPHHLFLGITDAAPLPSFAGSGLFETFRSLRGTPGYLGAWPKAGFLDVLPFNLGGSLPDPQGYSRLPLGVWRRQWDAFSVVSFDPSLLEPLPKTLRVVPANDEAQVRVHVADISQGKLAPWVNGVFYERARQASVGNVKLLHLLHQQFQVPRGETKELAEDLLDAELVCPLGGTYELAERPDGVVAWQSSAWPTRSGAALPVDFRAPVLRWFRGLDARLVKLPDQLAVSGEIRMERTPPPPAAKAEAKPLFNFNIFGGGKPGAEAPPPAAPGARPPRNDADGEKGKRQKDF